MGWISSCYYVAVPDAVKDQSSRQGWIKFGEPSLDVALKNPIRRAIQSGVASGVFAPQLHGQCHYWPQALITAAQGDAGVRAWLTGVSLSSTEALPAHLQSRWIDASQLPSRALDAAQIAAAVEEEAASYRKLFGASPEVAVPTTFVWNADVERAWKSVGVEVVITPGRRATRRDAAGQLTGVDRLMLTGESSDAGQCYLVRDVYCEPALGHSAIPDAKPFGIGQASRLVGNRMQCRIVRLCCGQRQRQATRRLQVPGKHGGQRGPERLAWIPDAKQCGGAFGKARI